MRNGKKRKKPMFEREYKTNIGFHILIELKIIRLTFF